jgi:chemotaxis protein MotB
MKLRNVALLIVLVAAVALGGCSCKQYQNQITSLDQQIADLQGQLGERESTLAECNDMTKELQDKLKAADQDKAALVEQMNETVIITLDQSVTYASSQFIVLDTMVPTLQTIAGVINEHPDWEVYVEGNTDDVKILEEFQDKIPSNWELGALRSGAVTRYLTNQLNMDPKRFAVVSYGPYRPVASNDTADGRAQNRRVRIVLHKPPKAKS